MAGAQDEGENAIIFYVKRLKYVRLQLLITVIGYEPRVAVNGHLPYVFGFAHQQAHGPTIFALLLAIAKFNHTRICWQPVLN